MSKWITESHKKVQEERFTWIAVLKWQTSMSLIAHEVETLNLSLAQTLVLSIKTTKELYHQSVDKVVW